MPESNGGYRFNGRAVSDPALMLDRGLQYGDGVFRTLAVYQGKPLDLQGQLAHLQADAGQLDIAVSVQQLAQECRDLAAGGGNAALKVIVTRGSSQRGYATDAAISPNRLLYLGSPPSGIAQRQEAGILMLRCQTRAGRQPGLAGIKHLNRLTQVLARRECQQAGLDEGLILDENGHLVSGVQSNLFLVDGVTLRTPDVACSGVAGRMRARIMDLARRQGLLVESGNLQAQALQTAGEVFLTNSLIGIWPVVELEQQHWPVGPVTRKLQAALQHPALS